MISVEDAHSIHTSPIPDCYVCGAQGQPLYADLQDHLFSAPGKWNLKKCPDPGCGLIWLDPIPNEEDIGRVYEQYYTHDTSGRSSSPDNNSLGLRLYLIKKSPLRPLLLFLRQGYYASALGYVPGTPLWQRLASYSLYLFPREVRRLGQQVRYAHYIPGGRLLDVGCGNGTYLAYMRDLGWEVEGVEVDHRAVEQAQKLNLPVYLGSVEQKCFKDNQFDVISMNHVIEHVHDPLKVLKVCYRILKPGGTLIAITPNTSSAAHSWFREFWRGLEPPRHIHLFTSPALRRLAMAAGFHVQMRTSAAGASWVYIESEHISRNFSSSGLFKRTFLSFRARFFSLYETFAVRMSKDLGEEIVVTGVKQ